MQREKSRKVRGRAEQALDIAGGKAQAKGQTYVDYWLWITAVGVECSVES